MSSGLIQNAEHISNDLIERISQRYTRIERTVRTEFLGEDALYLCGHYVGSYGRGTAIDESDIDMLVSLPKEDYKRFDAQKRNGQSRLLQSVKNAIEETYPNTDIRADGQVVVVNFSDGMKFEILPAFYDRQTQSYTYPDTHMGGNWKSTDPFAEQRAMKVLNQHSNGLLFDTCKHIRRVHMDHFKDYKLSGIVIDSFTFFAMEQWHWLRPNEERGYDTISFEQHLLQKFNELLNQTGLYAPGSNMQVNLEDGSLGCLYSVLKYMAK